MKTIDYVDTRKQRTYFVFSLISLILILVIIKSAYLQIINREKLISYSRSQTLREITIYPDRGRILDRNGNPLAMNLKAYNIFVIPKLVLDTKVYGTLEKIVPEWKKKNLARQLKNKKKYTWIARKFPLSEKQVGNIKQLKGVFVEESPVRVYPNNTILSQVIGFVGQDNKGLSGLEYSFDEKLRGKPHKIKFVKDAKGRPLKSDFIENGNLGEDIYLSIDLDIQASAEKFLREAITKHNARSGGIGIMDAETGEMIALANYPTYDANRPGDSNGNFKLPFVTDPIEPGSSMKTLTVAASFESGLSNSSKKYNCEGGNLRIGDHVISEAENKKKFEWLTVGEILKYSSNVGTTKVAFELGAPRLLYFLERFGIGKKTGIEVSGESRGIVPVVEKLSQLRLSNVSFGQGIATTAIQMLSAYAVIANGGYSVSPTLQRKTKSDLTLRILSEKTVEQLKKMLISAVEEGTGTNAKIKYFKIAGKTSTAQRVSESGGYRGYIPGFIGFTIGTPKKYVGLVYIDDPQVGGYYGNEIAAPVFKKTLEYLLIKDKQTINVVRDDADKLHSDKVKLVLASANTPENVVPSLIGLDKKSAERVIKNANIKVNHIGVGLVKRQSWQPGTILDGGIKEIDLYYEPPSVD